MTWWRRLWNRRHVERQLDAELRDHGRGTRWIDDSTRDLQLAMRITARDPGFAATIVVSLALGIGVCSMAFTITDAYFFRGLPVSDPTRMLYVGTTDAEGDDHGVSFADYRDWQAALPAVDMSAFKTGQMNVGERGRAADRISGAFVTAEIFRLLNVQAAVGRVFGPEDERPGTAVALVGHRLWRQRFESDPLLPGRTILVNGLPTTVIGVMPEGFGFPVQQELWLPLAADAGLDTRDRGDRSLAVLARLRDGQSRRSVDAAWRTTAATLAATYPATNTGITVDIVRFGQHQVGRLWNSPALMLPVTAVVVLLIACTNVANLLLARGTTRTRELAIRVSIGATRWRIVRQLLAESLLLAGAGGVAGFGIATLAVNAVAKSFFEGYVPYWMTFTADTRSIVAVGLFSVVSTIAFGLAPALRASGRGMSAAGQTGVRSNLAARPDPWSARLVAAQFALAVVLLGGAGLLVSSYSALLKSDDVLDASRVITMRVELPETTGSPDDRRKEFYRQLEDRLASTPGVERVAFASVAPFLAASNRPVTIRGQSTNGETTVNTPIIRISTDYFETLGLSLLRGRPFEPADSLQVPAAAIVNLLFAERYFPGRDAIGEQIQVGSAKEAEASGSGPVDKPVWLTIVGVSPTVRQAIAAGPRPVVYVPQVSAHDSGTQVILRTSFVSAKTAAAVRTHVAQLDAAAVLVNVRPLTETRKNSRLQPQLIATVLGSLGAVALFLSCVGLYAITSHAVRQRTAEIGLRLALGGTPLQIVWLCMRRALTPIAAGLLVGLAGAFGVGQLLRGLLIGTSATDPTTFAALVAVLTTVTLAACFVPARRGTKVDPASTLRQD